MNALAAVGCPVYMHGVDGNDARVQRGKLRVCTWHASKGTQNKAVIVLGVDAHSQHNPLHVALTRSRCELIVIQDRQKQHVALVRAAKALPDVLPDAETRRSSADEHTDVAPAEGRDSRRPLHNLEGWAPRGRCARASALLVTSLGDLPAEDDSSTLPVDHLVSSRGMWEDVTPFLLSAVLLCAEQETTGICKRVQDMLHRQRASRDALKVHLERGSDVRYLDQRVRDGEILPPVAQRALDLGRNFPDGEADAPRWTRWCTLAVCAAAWGGFHHLATRLLPVEWPATAPTCSKIMQRVASVRAEQFDVLLTASHDECLFYTRAHAVARGVAWTFVYADSIGQSTLLRASVPLALQDALSKACVLNVRTGQVATIERRSSAKELLHAFLE